MVNKQFATAVHIMTSLSFAEEPISSSYLAGSVNTNPVVIRRLLLQLQKAGLVQSTKGQNGGVTLKRSANSITLEEIYEAVQTSQMISAANRKIKKSCPVSRSMKSVMCQIATGAEEATKRYLRNIHLSDLKKKVNE